jgi:predicted 2-oxoglutarate/Fe(II)-dependent dioxygenase YbiX
VDVKVNKNELILFPSVLLHYVPPTTNKNKRISIAFNSFIEGNIGKDFKLNQLKL